MRTEVGVRKDRWQRLTFGESNLSLITSVLKSPSSAVFPFMRLPKKSKTVTTDSTKPGLGFHSCDFRRNLATLLRHGVNRLLRCFHSCGSRRNLATRYRSSLMATGDSFHSCGSRRNLATIVDTRTYLRWILFPFMRLPKEPCDRTVFKERSLYCVSIHAAPEGTLRQNRFKERSLCCVSIHAAPEGTLRRLQIGCKNFSILFPFMRLPKEPCDTSCAACNFTTTGRVSIHAAPEGTLRQSSPVSALAIRH